MTTTPHAPSYVFADTDTATGRGHHGALVCYLADTLDPFTISRLEPHLHPAARCLEVGAGAGSIAYWLAERTPDGQVTATDIDLRHVPVLPNVTRLRHDIATDPLEPAAFDLIHARLVLAHLPNRYQVLGKLVDALASGGVLVIEEFAAGGWDRCVLDTPDPEAHRLFADYHEALIAVMESAGTDTSWGRDVHQAMRECGLVNVRAEFWARTWHGGQAGCLLPHAASAQLRPKLVEAGMSDEDIDRFRALLLNPQLVIHNSLAVSTTGRKP